MTLLKFLEAKFTYNSIHNQGTENFSAWRDGELKATNAILSFIRWVMKVLAIPKLLIEYPLVKMGLTAAPEDSQSMIKRLKEDAELKLKTLREAQDQVQKPGLNVVSSPETPA